MNGIKSLADQLRETIRAEETAATPPAKPATDAVIDVQAGKAKTKKQAAGGISEAQASALFDDIAGFLPELTEKSMIRVDRKTLNLLKRVKLAKGIDMNRFIVYCLHHFLNQHPWLAGHIQETLKNTEL